MKKLSFVLALAATTYFVSCADYSENPNNQTSSNTNTEVVESNALFAAGFSEKDAPSNEHFSVGMKEARALQQTGKIYLHGDYILVNEMRKGIHVIDNADPKAPKNIGFIDIPGNVDIAMKDNILYADNYTDLLVMDVKTGEVSRVPSTFHQHRTPNGQIIAMTNSTSDADPLGMNRVAFNAVSHTGPTGGASMAGPGTGGSMARFAIVGDYLYVIDGDEMKIFDISTKYDPKQVGTVAMDFDVETIFPYEDKLFIGGTQGMYVFDNSNPTNPEQMSQFEHAVACDPVVVENNIAYVTLRGGTPCRNSQNELLVVDMNDMNNPQLVKSYEMHNPHGLTVDNGMLYLCDGNQGLKVYNTYDKENIVGNSVAKIRDIKTYDVIASPNNSSLIVVGKDGLYQYDRTDASELPLLSTIPVERAS